MRVKAMQRAKLQVASTAYTLVAYDEAASIAVIAVLTVLMNGE